MFLFRLNNIDCGYSLEPPYLAALMRRLIRKVARRICPRVPFFLFGMV